MQVAQLSTVVSSWICYLLVVLRLIHRSATGGKRSCKAQCVHFQPTRWLALWQHQNIYSTEKVCAWGHGSVHGRHFEVRSITFIHRCHMYLLEPTSVSVTASGPTLLLLGELQWLQRPSSFTPVFPRTKANDRTLNQA